MPPSFYPPYPELAAIAAILFAVFLSLFLREWRDPNRRAGMAMSLSLAVISAVAMGGLAMASYQEYVLMNTWTYFYGLDIQPNVTHAQAVIVPVPVDTSLLADLHLVSGEANWSFTDTVHGRGLYVRFIGPTTIESRFSEFAPGGSNRDTRLTMTNASAPSDWGPVWIYYMGSGGVTLQFQSGSVATIGSPALVAGWNLCYLAPIP